MGYEKSEGSAVILMAVELFDRKLVLGLAEVGLDHVEGRLSNRNPEQLDWSQYCSSSSGSSSSSDLVLSYFIRWVSPSLCLNSLHKGV